MVAKKPKYGSSNLRKYLKSFAAKPPAAPDRLKRSESILLRVRTSCAFARLCRKDHQSAAKLRMLRVMSEPIARIGFFPIDVSATRLLGKSRVTCARPRG